MPAPAAASSSSDLPLPGFVRVAETARWGYRPDATSLARAAGAWAREHEIRPACDDGFRTHLLLVDLQQDFCLPEGSLFVSGKGGSGAVDDNRRLIRFIYRNLARLTEITCTLDSHLAYQIFFPSFWLDADGEVPEANREVRLEDLRAGRLRPNPAVSRALGIQDPSLNVVSSCSN